MTEHEYSNIIEESVFEEEEEEVLEADAISIDSDELLVDLVKSHSFLYIKGSADHKDKLMRSNAWKEIAEVLHISAKEAEHRWNLLRDKFTRERKTKEQPSGSGRNNGKPWALYEKLIFLNEHAKRRKTISTIPAKNPKLSVKSITSPISNINSGGSGNVGAHDTEVFIVPHTPTQNIETESDSSMSGGGGSGNFRKIRKADALDQEFAALSCEMMKYYRERRSRSDAAPTISVEDQFASLVAAELKKLSESVQKEKKKAILAILYGW